MKWIFISLGTLSVMGGVVTFWLPLPIGVPLFLIGIAFLMRSSPRVRDRIVRLSSGNPKIEKLIERISTSEQLEKEDGKERAE